jgi:hypothetical protein
MGKTPPQTTRDDLLRGSLAYKWGYLYQVDVLRNGYQCLGHDPLWKHNDYAINGASSHLQIITMLWGPFHGP